ncbi:MAG TPA: DUF2752 domain-containing protein [Pyrinomonadaceae bacterium]|nr:DUF2752 domain-containing protein [Pyrinomonadaceae bacterium]
MSFSQPDISVNSTPVRSLAGVGVATMVVGAAAVWYFDPTTAGFLPACPLYQTTGFACPGCGMTRGFHALFHGDVLTALDFNALIPLVTVFLGYIFVSMALVAARGRGLLFGKWNLVLLWGTLGVLIVFGILRNLPYYPFTILFP